MKRIIVLIFILYSIPTLAQKNVLGLKGAKVYLPSLNVLSPLYSPADSIIAIDTSRFSFTSIGKNATRDSVIYLFKDGTRIAVRDSIGGGSSDTTFLRLTANNLGVTRDFSKGLALMNYTAPTLGNQQISPQIMFTGRGWNTTSSAGNTVDIIFDVLPVQGTAVTGYGRIGHRINGGAVTDNILTFGNAAAGATPSVGINAVPLAGFALNVGGLVSLTSINTAATSATLTNFGNSYLDFAGSSGSLILRLAGSSVYNAVSTDKNVTIGSSAQPTFGASLDLAGTSYAFLPPRMTTTQRDAINLTVTSVTITNAGSSYATAPTLTFTTGPIPTEANTAKASCTVSGGAIATVSVNGSYVGHYNIAPTITITPTSGGTGAILTPVMTQVLTKGMVIYNTTTDKLQCWNGTIWNDLF